MGLIVVGILLIILGCFLQSVGNEPAPPPLKWKRGKDIEDPLAINGVEYEIEEDEPESEGMQLLISEGIMDKDKNILDRQKGIFWFMREAKKKKRSQAVEEAIRLLGPILEGK